MLCRCSLRRWSVGGVDIVGFGIAYRYAAPVVDFVVHALFVLVLLWCVVGWGLFWGGDSMPLSMPLRHCHYPYLARYCIGQLLHFLHDISIAIDDRCDA